MATKKKAAKGSKHETKPAKDATTAAVDATQEATTTWPDVLRRLGPPTADDLELYSITETPKQLAKRGREIRTSKVLTDLVRWLGQIADYTARTRSTSAIVGFDLGMARVAAADGSKLQDMLATFDGAARAQSATKSANTTSAESALDRGSEERDALAASLQAAFASNPAGRAETAAAYGTAKLAPDLAAALGALEKIARREVDKKTVAGKRLVRGGVTADYLKGVTALAKEVADAGTRAKGARSTGEVTQADLDTQDGRCLAQMEQWIPLFDAAHARDTRVPKLVPISTLSYFGKRATHAATPEPPPPDPPPALPDPPVVDGAS